MPLHLNKTCNMLNEAGFHSMPFFPRLNIYKPSRVCVAHKHCMPQCGAIMCNCTQRATPRSNNWHCQINLAQCSLRSLCNHSSPPLYFFSATISTLRLGGRFTSPLLFGCAGFINTLSWELAKLICTCLCLNFSLWGTYNLKAQISKIRQPREDSVVDAI